MKAVFTHFQKFIAIKMISSSEVPSCKIIFLGNSGVGKTTLVSRWTSPIFDSTIRPTIGVNHQRKRIQINNEEVDLFIWDTAGQEQFRALTPLYTRSASFAIITVAINDLSSFNSIENWIELLSKTCDEMPPIALAVNKMDLAEEMVISEEQVLEKYEKKFSGNIFFVSAFNGKKVDDMFMKAATDGFNHYKEVNNLVTKQVINDNDESKKKCC